jgi:hypothetical protein
MSDWQPDPRPSPFDDLMARAGELPEATWANPGDLSRMSIAAMAHRSDPRGCPFERCYVCEPHEGSGAYPPNVVLGEN